MPSAPSNWPSLSVRPDDHSTLPLASSTENSMNSRRKPTPLGRLWPVRLSTRTAARSPSAGRLEILDGDGGGLLARELEQGVALRQHARLGRDVHPGEVRVSQQQRELLLEAVQKQVQAREHVALVVASHRQGEVLGRQRVVVAVEAVVLDVRDLERQLVRARRRVQVAACDSPGIRAPDPARPRANRRCRRC